ncbi:hypothetical protein [Rhodococcus koreensis]
MKLARRELERATTARSDRVLYVIGAIVGGILAVGAVAALLIVDFEPKAATVSDAAPQAESQSPAAPGLSQAPQPPPQPAPEPNQANLGKLPVGIVDRATCHPADPDSAAIALQVKCKTAEGWPVVVRTYPNLAAAGAEFPMMPNSETWPDRGSANEGGQRKFSEEGRQLTLRFDYSRELEPVVVDVLGSDREDEMRRWFAGADKRLE